MTLYLEATQLKKNLNSVIWYKEFDLYVTKALDNIIPATFSKFIKPIKHMPALTSSQNLSSIPSSK